MHATVRRVGTDAQLQRSLLEEGFAAIPTSRLDTTGAAFAGEAAALRERAERVAKDAFELWADGQEFRSPVSYGIAFDTERLHDLHFGGELRELANGLAGRDMEPTYSGYLYFEDGDFIGLHTDLPACELTFLAPVRPACPPLVVHPELAGMGPERLKELAEAVHGTPTGGTELPIATGGLVALFGGGLPHQTRPVRPGGASVVATLCYAGN